MQRKASRISYMQPKRTVGEHDFKIDWLVFNHLADGPQLADKSVLMLPWLLSLMRSMWQASSSAKASFSFSTTSVIVGLSSDTSLVHSNAMSTTFQTEPVSYAPLRRGSTIALMSPLLTFCFTRCTTCPTPGTVGGSPVTVSSRTTPKLKTSLLKVSLPLK